MSVIVITGCSTGIGFSTAETLGRRGHKVYATMRDPEKSPELQILADRENLPINVLSMDVDSGNSVTMTISKILAKEGFIDVLINNAGIASSGAVEELPMDSFKNIMETNYFGAVRCIQTVLPSMRERKSGCIINVSSVAGRIYSYFHAPYCASKAALEALSECLAQEVFPFNITIAVVEPGVVGTSIFTKGKKAPINTYYNNIKRFKAFFGASLDNFVQPKVVAEVILQIAEGNSNKFRNLAGPDAASLITWRASMSDEDWFSSQNTSAGDWVTHMKQHLNLNVEKHL